MNTPKGSILTIRFPSETNTIIIENKHVSVKVLKKRVQAGE